MSEKVTTEIESRIKMIQEQFQQKTDYLSKINEAIKKLRIDRITTQNEINTLNGALQAFSISSEVIKTFSDGPKTEVINE